MTAVGVDRGIAFAACEIVPEARRAALAVLESGWVTTGPLTPQFERAFAAWVGADDAVAVSSCTAAIELSLRALRLPPGTAVLSPTLTFCGAVHAIVHAGLRPVLVDVDERTLVPSPADVEAAAERIRPRRDGGAAHGRLPRADRRAGRCRRADPARVVEDAAHGLGAAVGTAPVGTVSRATCFSFYATKNLPIGEGGAVTTSDPEVAALLRQSRLHGMSRDAWRRYHGSGWRYSVEVDGLKANFTDLQAAIGLAQLPRLTGWQRRRAELGARYDAALRGVPGVEPRPGRRRVGTPGICTSCAWARATRSAATSSSPRWPGAGSGPRCTSSPCTTCPGSGTCSAARRSQRRTGCSPGCCPCRCTRV